MPHHPLHAVGRGINYTPLRALGEMLLKVVYRGDWPARAWSLVPGRALVERLDHALCLDPAHPRAIPLRIAFASDLHLGPTTPKCVLDRAFRLLREAAPDVLVLGGDYVYLDATAEKARELRDRVLSVPAPTKLAVMGNHDLWTHHGLLEDALAEAGARVLINDAVRLPAPFDDIAMLGLDDPWTGQPDGARAVAACGDAAVRLGICHAPDGVPFLRGRGVSLLLSGHTHGGQIALPGSVPIIIPGPLGNRWPYGLHREDDLTLFVSRGVGATELPIRTFATPDIAVFTVT